MSKNKLYNHAITFINIIMINYSMLHNNFEMYTLLNVEFYCFTVIHTIHAILFIICFITELLIQ